MKRSTNNRKTDGRKGFDPRPIFLNTDADYQWVAEFDPPGQDSRYALYRIYRWGIRPAEIVASGIDLKTARNLAGAPDQDGGKLRSDHDATCSLPRDQRQQLIASWAEKAFGHEESTGLPQRGIRLLEEAIEAFQACGGDEAIAHKLVAFVFARPPGTIGQELGGVAVTVLALAAAAGLSADEEEAREVHRVLNKPVREFTERNASKNAAGFKMVRGPLWAECHEPVHEDNFSACGWSGEMSQLEDRDGIKYCPNCGSTAIREDIDPRSYDDEKSEEVP